MIFFFFLSRIYRYWNDLITYLLKNCRSVPRLEGNIIIKCNFFFEIIGIKYLVYNLFFNF